MDTEGIQKIKKYKEAYNISAKKIMEPNPLLIRKGKIWVAQWLSVRGGKKKSLSLFSDVVMSPAYCQPML